MTILEDPLSVHERAIRKYFALGEQILYQATGDVRKAEVAPGITIRELLVVEAEKTKQRSMEVVDVHLVFGCGEAELIGRAVDEALLQSRAGQPHRETVG